MHDFGVLIREAREHQGLAAKTAAARIGIDPSMLSRMEHGQTKETPSPEVLRAISRVYDIPVPALLDAMGYDVDGSDDYDEMAAAISRAVAHWTPRQKQMLWTFVRTVNETTPDAGPLDHAS